MRFRTNLGSITSFAQKDNNVPSNKNSPIGKVYGVITTNDTPTPKLYNENGGALGIGTIFYKIWDESSKQTDTVDLDKEKLETAKPLFPHFQDYPLLNELVLLIDGPSSDTQNKKATGQKYYICAVNIWNNVQENAPTGDLGKTFDESPDVKRLLSFEGDRIYQGRKGNSIRFGSTVKLHSDLNEWSSIGDNGDPIMIISNTSPTIEVEEINTEKSSIYLTSTQLLPLHPGASIVNPRVNTVLPKDYKSSQLILNSDRITLNSKLDEVLLFSKTNIELNSDNIININAGTVAHINSPSINLGTNSDGSYPTEPVLLGNQTMYAFDVLMTALTNLASSLSIAATQDGPIVACNNAGTQLFADIDRIGDQLDKILSTKVYTI